MATISSLGIGSGLDVKTIVSQLVAIEKQPLDKLKLDAATVNTKISAYGEIKSLFSTLSDAASSLGSLTTWNAVTASSSNASAVTATAVGGTSATEFSVEVLSLAKAQSTASQALTPVGGTLGEGTMHLEIGSWDEFGTFTGNGNPAVDIEIVSTDTVASIASKINSANAGVTATVLTDASGERLLLKSKSTGVEAGFNLTVTDTGDGGDTDDAGLSRLVYEATPGANITQYGADAKAKLNGVEISSASNTFTNVVSGVSFTALQETTSAVDIKVSQDLATIQARIQGFVDAYNAINDLLSEATKYDAATKTAGLLQGDSTAVGLLNAMRGMLQSTTAAAGAYSAITRLADVGVTAQLGGSLSIDSAKLSSSLKNFDEVKNMFRASTDNPMTEGVALKFKRFSQGLLSVDGFFSSKDASLKRTLDQNSKNQAKINAHVTRYETQLNARYSALDTKIASLKALNDYVAQQVTQWNKSTG